MITPATEPDFIAIAALVLSFIALVVSGVATFYSKRQADAAEGNLSPAMEIGAGKQEAFGRNLQVGITNHNRQAIHVTRFRFKIPRGLKVMHKPSPGADNLVGPSRDFRMPFPVRLAPNDGKSIRNVFYFFTVPVDAGPSPGPYKASADVWYTVGNSNRAKRMRVSTRATA